MVILLLFFLSGATALVYEVIWSKYLSLMFGSTVQAQTIVLSVFMGGLALGNRWLGKWSSRIREPLATYGFLELGIGAFALLFPICFRISDRIFVQVGSPLLEHTTALLLLKAGLSVGLLIVPTVMMGGTLPLLADWLSRHTADASRRSARFYSTNSLGAVTGAGIAGFYLIRHWGLEASLGFAAVVNIGVGIAAVMMARRGVEEDVTQSHEGTTEGNVVGDGDAVGGPDDKVASPPHPGPLPQGGEGDGRLAISNAKKGSGDTEGPRSTAERSGRRGSTTLPGEGKGDAAARAGKRDLVTSGCLLVALTGGVSMGLEVTSSRFLSLIFGASTHAFAIVLMAFILGIGIGAAIIASPRFRSIDRERTTILLLLGAASLVGIFLWAIEWWVEIYRVLRASLADTEQGYLAHQLMISGISLVVLGMPAGLLGAVLPLWIRIGPAAEEQLGEPVGRLLTWNTLGAVVGVLLTGFVLMPVLGLRAAFGVLALILCGGALVISRAVKVPRLKQVVMAVSAVLLVSLFLGNRGWRLVLSSGIFRPPAGYEMDRYYMKQAKKHVDILFYQDGADATVSVTQGDDQEFGSQIVLRVNGKPDASTSGDLGTQYLLAHLPMLARPESKDVFVLGFGSGITAGALLGHPVERIDIAENCGPVLRAGEIFGPWNRDVLKAPVTRVWHEDGRTVLKLNSQDYDLIISEPSNPWMAGVGSVFSVDFYQLAAARLKDGGIMTQWFHRYEMSDAIMAMIVRTFSSVFRVTEVWDTGSGDIVMLGSNRPWPTGQANFDRVWAREVPRQDLESVGITTPAAVWLRQLASQRTAFAIVDQDGGVQSDAFPVLEYEAPKAFYLDRTAELLEPYDERVNQSLLAPAEKRTAIRRLTPREITGVFAEYGTSNPKLRAYLDRRYPRPGTVVQGLVFDGDRPLATLLEPVDPAGFALQGELTPEYQRLIGIERRLLTEGDDWQSGVEAAVALLGVRLNPEVHRYYLQLAIKTCVREGDITGARRVLQAAQILVQGAEMDYLARVVARLEELQPRSEQ